MSDDAQKEAPEDATQGDETPAPAGTDSDQTAEPGDSTGTEPDASAPASRADLERLREEHGAFHAEVREALGRLQHPAPEESSGHTDDAEKPAETLAPEAKPEPKPKPEPAAQAESAPSPYGSRRWFAGR